MLGAINVVCAFHLKGIGQIDFHDHLAGLCGKNFVVAHGSGRNDLAGFRDGYRFDDGHIHGFDLLPAQLFPCFRQVIVDIHDFAAVDGIP